jgi:hypothetical protein
MVQLPRWATIALPKDANRTGAWRFAFTPNRLPPALTQPPHNLLPLEPQHKRQKKSQFQKLQQLQKHHRLSCQTVTDLLGFARRVSYFLFSRSR